MCDGALQLVHGVVDADGLDEDGHLIVDILDLKLELIHNLLRLIPFTHQITLPVHLFLEQVLEHLNLVHEFLYDGILLRKLLLYGFFASPQINDCLLLLIFSLSRVRALAGGSLTGLRGVQVLGDESSERVDLVLRLIDSIVKVINTLQNVLMLIPFR